jgi:hypothetical protein
MNILNKNKCGACGKTKYFTKKRTITPKKLVPQGILTNITSNAPLCRKCYLIAKTRL